MKQKLSESPRLRATAKALPDPVQGALRRLARTDPRWGNLRRTRPFSERYGFDRGMPLDRFYIERFLTGHADAIGGRVLEVRDSRYADLLGGGTVESVDVLDVDPRNAEATIVADLAEPDSLPASRFDCFVMTQTLQYPRDPGIALANAARALRPGGTLLLTAPALSRIDPELRGSDRWRFTAAGLETILDEQGFEEVDVAGYGNLVAATAFLLGLAAEELDRRELELEDPDFQIVACARARTPAAG